MITMMKKHVALQQHATLVIKLCWAMLVCASTVMANDAQPTAESLYQRLARTVVRFERVPDEAPDKRTSIGTGFFVLYHNTLYLVTALHVLASSAPMHARIPALRQDSQQLDVIELRVPHEAWVAHPSKPSELVDAEKPGAKPLAIRPVDVVVARLPWPPAHQLAPIRTFAAADPEPPEPVLVFGYPHDLGFALTEQRPLGRAGIVAMAAKAPYIFYYSDDNYSNGSYADGRVRALDIRMFEGNSGSPVLRAAGIDKDRVLLGLVAGGDSNLDIAVSEPVSRIRETLEFAHSQDVPAEPEWLPAAAKGQGQNTQQRDAKNAEESE